MICPKENRSISLNPPLSARELRESRIPAGLMMRISDPS